MPILKPAIERVLDKIVAIPFSGCWIFMGATNEFGYGIVGAGGKGVSNDRAHRVTYKHFKGEIPKGMFVCHTCDVPSCCNPEHLFLGTNQDNVDDMVKKKRNSKPPRNPHVVGSVHPLSKLHDSQAVEIRCLYADGKTQQNIAEIFGVARQTISKIVNNKRYAHV
jgi:DNA-binding CsgD family transcriptional regulator